MQAIPRLRWPPNVASVPLPPYSPELNPIERLWRDLKDQLADTVAKTLDALSDTVCHLIQNYAPAALKSLTGFAYFVQAVQTALQLGRDRVRYPKVRFPIPPV